MTALLWESPCRRIALHVGDCRDLMASMADKSVDHVITDPPYSDHVHKSVRTGRKGGQYGISQDVDLGFGHLGNDLRGVLAREFARLTRRWSLVFSDVESCRDWRVDLVGAGLDYVRTGVWVKDGGGAPQFTGDRPAPGYESITIVHPPGRKKWNGGGTAGVWSFATAHRSKEGATVHPTQKPIALMRKLVSLFTDPTDLILDPFAGSATTLVAAYEQGRRAIGCELDPKNADAAAKRLEQMTAQGALFGVRP